MRSIFHNRAMVCVYVAAALTAGAAVAVDSRAHADSGAPADFAVGGSPEALTPFEHPESELLAQAAEGEEAEGSERTLLSRPMPGTDEVEASAITDFERALRDYEEEMLDYRRSIEQVVEVEYLSRRGQIRDFFQDEIDALRIEERARRAEAIADFEGFLERFPNHPDYAPDVIFRLAELNYEKAEDDYLLADIEYAELEQRYDLGLIAELPDPPEKNFNPSIRLFERLLNQFPDYRQADGAYYLLAMCQLQMDEYDPSLANFTTLVSAYPNSDFAQEGWLRIGEFHFMELDFQLARAAYERAIEYGDSIWYDKTLFKLGWSNYLLNDYDTAINNFQTLLRYYGEDDDGATEKAVREEALQYFAIAVSEEDWDFDGEVDEGFVLGRVEQYLSEDEPFTVEVLDRIATMLMDNQRHQHAIDVHRYILERYPLDPENPKRHEQIIIAFSRMNEIPQALAEGRRLGELYGPDSEWWRAQEMEGNLEQMAYAEQLARDMLFQTANTLYVEGDDLAARAIIEGDDTLLAQSVQRYQAAAQIYEEFLSLYPNDPEAYTVQMYLGQARFNSDEFAEAATAFAAVRDSQISNQFRVAAAGLTISAYEKALEKAIDAGELDGIAWPAHRDNVLADLLPDIGIEAEDDEDDEDEAGSGPRDASQIPVPELSGLWAASIDRYVEMDLNAEDDPTQQGRYGYNAAIMYYLHGHYNEAKERFAYIVENYCGQDEVGFSAGFLMNSARLSGAFSEADAVKQLIERRVAANCVDPEILAALERDMDLMIIGIAFEAAEAYYREGDYLAAAQEYVRVVNQYPENEDAAKALFNAGLIYEQDLRMNELAMRQFDRVIAEYPQSEFINDTLVRIAINSKRFFDFDRAISTFQLLYDRGYNSDLVEHPLLDAAQLRDYSQQHREAIRSYEEWLGDNANDPRAPAVLYQTAVIYRRLGDERAAIRALERFRQQYGRRQSDIIDVDAAVIDSLHAEMEYYEANNNTRSYNRALDQLLDEFSARNPDNPESTYVVAELAYNNVVEEYEEWDSADLGETLSTQRTRLTERREGMQDLLDRFDAVSGFNSADWTVCAWYMRGRVYQRMADLLYSLPTPDFRGDYDAEDEYVLQIEGFASQYEDAAVLEWQATYPLMQQLGVVNECTYNMTRELNRYRGGEFPIFREAETHMESVLFAPQVFAVPRLEVEDEQRESIRLHDEDEAGDADEGQE